MRYSYILNSLFCQLFGGSNSTAWLPVDSPSSYHSLLECSCVIEREFGFPLRILLFFVSVSLMSCCRKFTWFSCIAKLNQHTRLYFVSPSKFDDRDFRVDCVIHLTISLAPTSEQMRLKAALLRTWFSCRILNSDNQQKFMSWMKNTEKKNDERISFWHLKSNSESSIRKTVGSIFWCKSFD